MRPVLDEKTGIGDERAFDRRPFVQVLRFEQRPDERCGEKKENDTVEDNDGPERFFPAPDQGHSAIMQERYRRSGSVYTGMVCDNLGRCSDARFWRRPPR